jgi:hypothetical protein
LGSRDRHGVAAVGTIGALGAALVQIARERSLRQRSERLAQASRVSAWYVSDDEHQTNVVLLNGSAEPVYRVLIFLVLIQAAGPTTGLEVMREELSSDYWTAFGVLPPGRYYTTLGAGWRGMSRQAGIEIAFSDRSGTHWVRHANGALLQLPEPPESHYGIPLPVGWATPSDYRPTA